VLDCLLAAGLVDLALRAARHRHPHLAGTCPMLSFEFCLDMRVLVAVLRRKSCRTRMMRLLLVCMYARLYACTLACMHVCSHVCMYARMYACMLACMHACSHVRRPHNQLLCVRLSMHTYTLTHTQGFVMGLVKMGLTMADLKKNVGWEVPPMYALPLNPKP
jgi:hypothetical protein